MDFKSLKELRDELEQDLATLKGDPLVEVPSILKLVELGITHLNEILRNMGPDDVYVDIDRQMTDRVSNEFELTNASSVVFFCKQLMNERRSINPRLQAPLHCTSILILSVAQLLERDLLKEVLGVQPDDTSADKNIEWRVGYAIDYSTPANTQDFCVDELFPQSAPNIDVDDDDVKKLISQKCNEAMEPRDKKLTEGDQGGSGPNRISKLFSTTLKFIHRISKLFSFFSIMQKLF